MAVSTDINEALLEDLFAIYTDVENQMLTKVAKRVKKGITEEGWNEAKLQDTQKLRKEIGALLNDKTKLAKSKVGKGILKAYKEGVNSAEKDAGKPLTAMQDLNIPLTIQNLLLTNYSLLDDANSKILRNANDAYRDIMAESATGLLSGVDTRMQASQKMMDRLAAKGITSFTDKAGRQWQLSSYAEMAMRTASNHAAIEGHIQTQQSFGMDLMRVSRIGTTCPICARWQGVVLSISGKTPGYHTVDEARAAGLFHPNCKHTIMMFDPEIDGEGQKELNSDADVAKATSRYDLIQQQRHNERMIRYWKRRQAGAVDPKAKSFYRTKVDQWSLRNSIHCEKNNLRRMPQREGLKNPNSDNAQFIDWFGKHLMGYNEDDLAKIILDESTIKSVLKNKEYSLTDLYKMYLGDTPTQDYKAVGTTQLTYPQWLKAKVMELTKDIPDPVDEMFAGPSTMTKDELKALKKQHSPTEIYKMKIGLNPTQDYKTGYKGNLTYAQWLTAQVNDLAMDKVYSTNSFAQGKAEIFIESTTHSGASIIKLDTLPLNMNAVVNEALYKVQATYDSIGMVTSVHDVVNEIKLASSGMAEVMNAKGQGALVKGGKIYLNPKLLGKVDADTITHELGHLVTKDGLKTSTASMNAGADELLAESKYSSFKEMASKVSVYACKSPTEFFAECFSIYNNDDLFESLPNESKELIWNAVQKMYIGENSTKPASAPSLETLKAEAESKSTPKATSWKEAYASKYIEAINKGQVDVTDYKEFVLDAEVTGYYSASQQVKAASNDYNDDPTPTNKAKYELAKLKDLSVHEENSKKLLDNFDIIDDKVKQFEGQLNSAKNLGLSGDVISHIENKKKIWEEALAESKAKQAEAAKKAQAQAQANAAAAAALQAQIAAKAGASGYIMGHAKLTKAEQDKFVAEFDSKHLSQYSSEGKELSKRLAKQQKEYLSRELGVDITSKADIRALESKIKNGTATDGEAALYAMHDYTRASGVYTWHMRGVNRNRSVNTSDHPLGAGMTEWEYGQMMSKHIKKYFDSLPPLQEDVYVHRVFGKDALDSLFGLESPDAKSKVNLSKLFDYAHKHPGETMIRDFSAISTSTFQEGTWNGNCELKLKVPKGAKAAYMGGIEAHDVEETILKPDQKMHVNAVYERSKYSMPEWDELARKKGFNPNREVVVYAEAIPEAEAQATVETRVQAIDDALKARSNDKSMVGAALRTEVIAEYNSFSKTITREEKQGLVTYSGSAYRQMNSDLRNHTYSSPSSKKNIEAAKSALNKARTTEDRVYERGSEFRALAHMLGDSNLDYSTLRNTLDKNPEIYNSGTRVVYDDAFLSTSPIDGGFYGDVKFKIFAPAGTKAAFIAPLSQHKGEDETLFQAGTRFRLLKIKEGRGSADFEVYLEALFAEDE